MSLWWAGRWSPCRQAGFSGCSTLPACWDWVGQTLSWVAKKINKCWCRETGLHGVWVGRQDRTVLVTAEFLRLCLHTTVRVPPLLVDKRLRWKEPLPLQNQVCYAQTLPGGTANRDRPAHSSVQQLWEGSFASDKLSLVLHLFRDKPARSFECV